MRRGSLQAPSLRKSPVRGSSATMAVLKWSKANAPAVRDRSVCTVRPCAGRRAVGGGRHGIVAGACGGSARRGGQRRAARTWVVEGLEGRTRDVGARHAVAVAARHAVAIAGGGKNGRAHV